ncbi:MAG: phosphoenolpyruvate synthase, partial [Planifilum fulgidum]
MKDVLPFEEIDRQSLPLVGGKGANLGEMYRAGLPVPPGFCVTTAAYRRITDELQEMDRWLNELNRLQPDQLDEIRALAEKIREGILSVTIPTPIRESILQAWTRLGTDHAFAVRSSA